MINLIPPRGHKVVKHEYYFRVFSTIGFLLTAVLVFLTAALIPTYVLVGAQIDAFKITGDETSSESDVVEKADQEVQLVREMLAQLKRSPESTRASVVIKEINDIAPESIVFNNFSISSPEGVIEEVNVKGKAPTRNSLAQLKEALESSEMFEKAEVPISDLAQVSDVSFDVKVVLYKQ